MSQFVFFWSEHFANPDSHGFLYILNRRSSKVDRKVSTAFLIVLLTGEVGRKLHQTNRILSLDFRRPSLVACSREESRRPERDRSEIQANRVLCSIQKTSISVDNYFRNYVALYFLSQIYISLDYEQSLFFRRVRRAWSEFFFRRVRRAYSEKIIFFAIL